MATQEQLNKELGDAARAGDAQKLRELITNGADIEANIGVRARCTFCFYLQYNLQCVQDGATPLTHAAAFGHMDAVRYLVEKGANIEARDRVRDWC